MILRAIYTVRHVNPLEQKLIRETVSDWKQQSMQRIVLQQLQDGFPTFRHYGIALSDGTVVHFKGKLQDIHVDAWIQRTSCAEFARGGAACEACEVRFAFPPEVVAQRALSQVGGRFGGYHFLWNNCEHFVNWCACGHRISRQVMMREKFQEE